MGAYNVGFEELDPEIVVFLEFGLHDYFVFFMGWKDLEFEVT